MTNTGIFKQLAGALGLVIMLGACDTLMGSSDAQLPCPSVSTLGDAAKITRFIEGPGRDLIDIDFAGKISHLSGKCFYEFDSDTGDQLLRVDIRPEFRMEKGAGNKTNQAQFEYFVSILDDQGNILQKQIFPFTTKYWKNRQFAKDEDGPVELSIQLSGEQSGQSINIFVGFQLTREELDYNRGDSNR